MHINLTISPSEKTTKQRFLLLGINVKDEYLMEDGGIIISYSLLGLSYDWVKSFEQDEDSVLSTAQNL